MDAKTCIQKLQYVGVLAFATVDEHGRPQVRNISAIHYEPDAIYFFTARGKDFCRELLADGHVQILGYTRYKEMIRLSAKAEPVPEGAAEEVDGRYILGAAVSLKRVPRGHQRHRHCV